MTDSQKSGGAMKMNMRKQPQLWYFEYKTCCCNWVGLYRQRPSYCSEHFTNQKIRARMPIVSEENQGWVHL